jgi:hypothetical protein
MRARGLAAAVALAALPQVTPANDNAVSVATGGIQPKVERRVAMKKERLRISMAYETRKAPSGRPYEVSRPKVTVDYEFVNEGPEAITTEVAFAAPRFEYRGESAAPTSTLADFRTWVNGEPVSVEKATRAFVGERDITDLLTAVGVSIVDFGGFDHTDDRWSPTERWGDKGTQQLLGAGALDPSHAWPMWAAEVTYHWRMTFPAGAVVRVRHEYTPSFGFSLVKLDELPADGCFDKRLVETLRRSKAAAKPPSAYVGLLWVDYILTTANGWKTPIDDFELVVERPSREFASFCWDGPVKRMGRDSFVAPVSGFRPNRELRVYFGR